MKIILKESQYKKLITEEVGKGFKKKLENLKDFFDEVSSDIKNQIGLDLSFLSTWGVTIAGFAKPVSDFVKGEFTEISQENLILLTVGLILTYYQTNKSKLKEVLDEIKKRDLIEEFDSMLSIAEKLKSVFISFIESLAVPTLKYSNILAYTFIIPFVGDLFDLATGNFSSVNPVEVVKMIAGYSLINLSGNLVKRILLAIVERFKS
jgi:hypothetical protein